MITIPTDSTSPFWTQVTTLDGVPYRLTFRYNGREAVYYLNIDSVDGITNYVTGLKLVANYPLLISWGSTPPGDLTVLSTNATNDSPPGLGELGDGLRCELIYLEEADLFTANPIVEAWRFAGFLV